MLCVAFSSKLLLYSFDKEMELGGKCRFSQILSPIFDETATKVEEESRGYGQIVFAKVDCDTENAVASKYHISKYPTLKLFRNGNVLKKEYRGQRSVEALTNYIREQMKDPIIKLKSLEDLGKLEAKKRHIIGYFISEETEAYKTYKRVSSALLNDCEFHAAVGPLSEQERTTGENMVYRPPHVLGCMSPDNKGCHIGQCPPYTAKSSSERSPTIDRRTNGQDVAFSGPMDNYYYMYQWTHDKCVPLVREITFENAEELTEEGLPFLILFHHPDDVETNKIYTKEVQNQLLTEQSTVNFLTADGLKFTHPLHHLGKSPSDLPVLCIDSFRHMYIFPHDVKKGISTPGILKQFISDLHSGKLHREFHHGPDTSLKAVSESNRSEDKERKEQHLPHDANEKPKFPTSPPESTFNKLKPSRNRYTILRDEL